MGRLGDTPILLEPLDPAVPRAAHPAVRGGRPGLLHAHAEALRRHRASGHDRLPW